MRAFKTRTFQLEKNDRDNITAKELALYQRLARVCWK